MSTAVDLRVHRATGAEVPLVASILREAFAEYQGVYTQEAFAATAPEPSEILVRMQQGPVWVAADETGALGTASVLPGSTGLYVRGMGVVPAARGRGIGRLLLQQAELFALRNGYKRMFLSTTPFLSAAIRLYASFGFTRTTAGPHDLYGTPLFTMEKVLGSAQGEAIGKET